MAEQRLNAFGDPIVGSPIAGGPQPASRRATDSGLNAFGDRFIGATRPPSAQEARSAYEAIVSGMQNSATVLAARRALPEYELPVDAPWHHRAASGIANVLTDLPLSVVAGIAGAIGGAAAGGAVTGPAAPAGAAVGGLLGAGAAGFGVPMGIRDALITAYNHDNATSWAGVWDIAASAAKGLTKGSIIGGLTGGAGLAVRAAAPIFGGAGRAGFGLTAAGKAPPIGVGREVAALGTELLTMTTAGAALEGHMPSAQDFMDNAILLGGLKVAMTTARRLRNTYAETGKTPEEIYGAAIRDPEIRADLTGEPIFRGVPIKAMHDALAKDYPEVTMRFERMQAGDIRLQEIEAKRTGEGLGHEPMQDFTRWLDENGHRSTLLAAEMGAVPEAKLVEFYRKHGYKVDEIQDYPGAGVKMTREPNPEIKLAADAAAATNAPRTLGIPRAYDMAALEQRIAAAIDKDVRPDAIRKTIAGEKEWVPLGEQPIADGVKYEYMTDSATAAGILRDVQNKYEAELAKQTRGEVSNKKTAIEALRLIANGPIDPHIIGQSANAAEIFARAHLLRGATAHAVAEIKKIASIPEAELTPALKLQALAAIERVSMLYGEVKGVGAEAGRALQIHRAIKRDSTMLDEAKFLLQMAERKGTLQDLAAMLEPMKDASQAAAFLDNYRKAGTIEKVLEAWKAAILSGPQTHLANIIGNSVRWMVEVPEAFISTAIYAGMRAAKGDALTAAQFNARAFAPIHGMQLGAIDGLKVAGEVWRGSGQHLEKSDLFRPAIEGKIGEIFRTPFKVLQMGDVLFRTPGERAEAYIMAVDRATKEGLHPETREWNEAVANWVQNPTDGLGEIAGAKAMARIQEAGAKMVFSEKLGSGMALLQRAMNMNYTHWTQFIVPFFRTPANLLSYTIQHLPGLNLLSARWREDFMAGGESRAKAISRVIVGTGIASAAFAFAESGVLTGSGQFEKEQAGTKRGAGWQPYSILIGDTYYSYQRIEPVAKILGIASDLVEMINATEKEEDKSKMTMMLIGLFGNATISTTYLSGLSSSIQAMTDPTRYAPRFLEQYASSLVPKIIGQTVAAFDPHKREVDSALDAIKSQLPYFRSQLLPKRDVWGEPMENSKWFAVLPVATSEKSRDLVKTEAVRLGLAIADAPKSFYEKGPLNRKDEQIKLEPDVRDVFKEVAGKEALDILAPIVNHPDWKQIPDFAQAKIYRDALRDARKIATQEALPADADLREETRENIQRKITDQIEKADSR